MSKKAKELAARYGRKSDVVEIYKDILDEQNRITAFAYPPCSVITKDEEIQVFKWGLIPFWTKSEQNAKEIKRMTLNARAETLFTKPSFREPIKRHRCIIPSTGYFEWRHEGEKKIPYYIFLKDEPVFSMAGIYDEWLNKETGEIEKTFSIITTTANPLTAYIHNNPKTGNRMPVILHQEDEERWLNPDLGKSDIENLLTPIEATLMDAYIIDNDFIKKDPRDKGLLEPAEK